MTWFTSTPDIGDWVTPIRTLPITLADHLTGHGIQPGTRGVVTERVGNRLTVSFGATGGTARIPARHVRVVRHHGGFDAYQRRDRILLGIRLGLAIWLLWPIILFTISYLWTNRTTDGLLINLAIGIAYGIGDLATAAIAHPVRSVAYLALTAVASRLVHEGPMRRTGSLATTSRPSAGSLPASRRHPCPRLDCE